MIYKSNNNNNNNRKLKKPKTMSCRSISNYQIKNAIANIGDNDVTNNFVFVGVFSSNYMNKFIDYAAMMKVKGEKYPFIIANRRYLKTRYSLVEHLIFYIFGW